MISKENLQGLFSALLFIIAGLIAPSNSVDDNTGKTTAELIFRLILFNGSFAFLYFILNIAGKRNFRE